MGPNLTKSLFSPCWPGRVGGQSIKPALCLWLAFLVPVALGCLWHPLGALGHSLGPFEHPWAPSGDRWCYFGRPMGDLGHHWGTLWAPWATILAPFGHTLEAFSTTWENVSKKTPRNHCGGVSFDIILGKVAHAIRTRLCSPNAHFTLISSTRF